MIICVCVCSQDWAWVSGRSEEMGIQGWPKNTRHNQVASPTGMHWLRQSEYLLVYILILSSQWKLPFPSSSEYRQIFVSISPARTCWISHLSVLCNSQCECDRLVLDELAVPRVPHVGLGQSTGIPPCRYPFTSPPIALCLFASFTFRFLLASSIFLLFYPFPFYQNSATPFPSRML